MSHTPYYVTLADATICVECSAVGAVLWKDAHPDYDESWRP